MTGVADGWMGKVVGCFRPEDNSEDLGALLLRLRPWTWFQLPCSASLPTQLLLPSCRVWWSSYCVVPHWQTHTARPGVSAAAQTQQQHVQHATAATGTCWQS